MQAMARIAALAFVAALLCAGCGSVEGGQATTATAHPSADQPAQAALDRAESSEWFMFVGYDDEPADPGSRPLAEALGVFAEPRTPADALPETAEHMFDGMTSAGDHDPGALIQNRSRRLLVGEHGAAVYGIPTENGWVCTIVVLGGNGGASGGCDEDLHRGLSPSIGGTAKTVHVAGLIADDVTSVDVMVDGSPRAAPLGRNAFALDVPIADLCRGGGPSSLALHHAGGETTTFPLGSPGKTFALKPCG
jgi:hypothetical protein